MAISFGVILGFLILDCRLTIYPSCGISFSKSQIKIRQSKITYLWASLPCHHERCLASFAPAAQKVSPTRKRAAVPTVHVVRRSFQASVSLSIRSRQTPVGNLFVGDALPSPAAATSVASQDDY